MASAPFTEAPRLVAGLLATQQMECASLHLAPRCDGMQDPLLGRGLRTMFGSAPGGGRLFDPQAPAAVHAWLWRLPCRPVWITGSGRTRSVNAAMAASSCVFPLELWFDLLAVAQGSEVP